MKKEEIFATFKSTETEDWLDYHLMRPLAYRWVKLFERWGTHPNTVTLISIIIGAVSCIFFAHGSFYYEGWSGVIMNILGFLLLTWAYVFDCTDGQLARLTGKKSKLGRFLDGAGAYGWYIPIYSALVYRFYCYHTVEFNMLGIANTPTNALIATAVVFALAGVSGIVCLAGQQRLADYYLQVHLFFLKGEKGSELDTAVKQQQIYDQLPPDAKWWERPVQKTYISYTRMQERKTPQFQRLMSKLYEKYGTSDQFPDEVRQRVHSESLKTMKYVFMLVFNFRTIFLYLFCLLDVPVAYFLFETIVITLIMQYVNRRHERFCKRIADEI